MRIKIQLDEHGNMAGYHKHWPETSPIEPAKEFVVETDTDPDFDGPNVVGLHCIDGRAVREKTAREIRRQLRSTAPKRPPRTLPIIAQAAPDKSPLADAAESATRIGELLLVVVLLALAVGVAASSIVAYLAQPAGSLITAVIVSIGGTFLLVGLATRRIAGHTVYRDFVTAGLPFNHACTEVLQPAPSGASQPQLFSDTPFCYQAALVLRRLRPLKLNPPYDLLQLTVFLTLLRSLSRRLDIPFGLSPYGRHVRLGPNTGYSDPSRLFYYAKPTSDIAPDDDDRRLLQQTVPEFGYLHLPAGIDATLSLKKPRIAMTAPGVRFAIESGSGMGNRLDVETAGQELALDAECFFWSQTLVFTLSFRLLGRRLWRTSGKASWSLGEHLHWMTEIVRWAAHHLDYPTVSPNAKR